MLLQGLLVLGSSYLQSISMIWKNIISKFADDTKLDSNTVCQENPKKLLEVVGGPNEWGKNREYNVAI